MKDRTLNCSRCGWEFGNAQGSFRVASQPIIKGTENNWCKERLYLYLDEPRSTRSVRNVVWEAHLIGEKSVEARLLDWAVWSYFLFLNFTAFRLKYSISCSGVIPSISFDISLRLFLMNATASIVFFVFASVFLALVFLWVSEFPEFCVHSLN